MRNFRLTDNPQDVTAWAIESGGDASIDFNGPATAGKYIGSAFEPQTPIGVRLTDPYDDRVDFMAGETGTPIGGTPQFSMPVDLFSTGVAAADGGIEFGRPTIATNPTRGTYNRDFHAGEDNLYAEVVINTNDGTWYDTLSPNAGYPLVAVSDKAWANETNDVVADGVNESMGLFVRVGERLVAEKPLLDPARMSAQPASIQEPRPWDEVMGSWPWTGEKGEANRPAVSTPLFFDKPVKDGVPSPTGAANPMWPNTGALTPEPMTWRTPPSPWDENTENSYIDTGTVRRGR